MPYSAENQSQHCHLLYLPPGPIRINVGGIWRGGDSEGRFRCRCCQSACMILSSDAPGWRRFAITTIFPSSAMARRWGLLSVDRWLAALMYRLEKSRLPGTPGESHQESS